MGGTKAGSRSGLSELLCARIFSVRSAGFDNRSAGQAKSWPQFGATHGSPTRSYRRRTIVASHNYELARVLFVIDACDREIIARPAVANAGVLGEMVRDTMVPRGRAPLLRRKDSASRRRALGQWRYLRRQGYGRRGTCSGPDDAFYADPQPGTQGNFVKTFKHDYVRPAILPDADGILVKLIRWIEVCCEAHLRRLDRSPRGFLRLSVQRSRPGVGLNGVHTKWR
jgi:hypothetical protein